MKKNKTYKFDIQLSDKIINDISSTEFLYVPITLFRKKRSVKLSQTAILIYSYVLRRINEDPQVDSKGRYYYQCGAEELMKNLRISRNTVSINLSSLRMNKLITTKGVSRGNLKIYLNDFQESDLDFE